MGANWKWRPYRRVFPSHLDAGVDDELRFHLSERVEALMAEGLTEDAARAQALAEFGDVHDVRRTLVAVDAGIERRRRRTEWIVSVWSDVRYAARTLRRAPRFTLAALTTLGLGVGLASMVIGAADAVLLRPLPYREPERLVSCARSRGRTARTTPSPSPVCGILSGRGARLPAWPDPPSGPAI